MSQNQQHDKQEKNTVLVLKGNYQQFDRLQTLFQSGELEKLLGFSIVELDAVSQYEPTNLVLPTEIEYSLNTEIREKVVKLRQWLENIFEPDWQPAIAVISSTAYQNSFRHCNIATETAIRAKAIDLGSDPFVVLLVSLTPKPNGEFEIILKVYPSGMSSHLPPRLKVTVLDEFDDVFEELEAGDRDPWLGLRFNIDRGLFAVRLTLEDIKIEEKFEI